MTQVVIDDVVPRTQLIATGGQTVFNTLWTADDETDVNVYARASGVEPDDVTQLVSPTLYTVTFVGASETVRVTFLSGRTANDVITIVRNTPPTRENLYINTNFTPSMLNQDFGILTLIDQQNEMYDTRINPGYNVSATIDPIIDRILPVLEANQVWAMNPTATEIIAYDVPASGTLAPGDAKYLIQTANSDLPNAQVMGALASGIVVNTTSTGVQLTRSIAGTTSKITVTNGTGISGNPTITIADNAIIGGTQGMGVPVGTTGQRPGSPSGTELRFNSTLSELEYWDGSDWVQLVEGGGVGVTEITGTANQVLANGTSGSAESGSVTLTTPQDIGTSSAVQFNSVRFNSNTAILDSAGATMVSFSPTATAVNFVQLTNADVGNFPRISAAGSDSAIKLAFETKGGSQFNFFSTATAPFVILSGPTNQHSSVFSFPTTAATHTYTYPAASGTLALTSDIPALTPAALTKTDDTNVTLTLGGTPATALLQATSLTLGWTGTLAATRGGLGVASPTAHGVLVGQGSSAVTPIVLTAGQVLIGTTASDPAGATLTAGTGISINSASGAITISSSGTGLASTTIAGTTQSAAVNNNYIVGNAGQTTITLPTTFAVGDVVKIKGLGAGGWILAAGTATTIRLGSAVTSSAGSLTSANQYDTVVVSGLVANTTWSVDSVISSGLTVA